MSDNASFRVLNISDILPNRFQPRIKFEDDSLDELAESISRFGVIEPIVVRPIGNKFEIIAGERRYKASKLASKTTIPSIVISLSDKDSEELALLENVQRQSLNPIEEAVSYKRILDMGYITREELSKKIGKPQSVILNKTRLLNLSDEVQSYLLNNKISERHARALLNISNLDDQVDMLHRIVNERLTVKKTNREIKNYLENLNDSDTETLFNNERGNDKMDIDKIMREAQDINTDTSANVAAPDLMTPGGSPQNAAQVFNSNPISNENNIPQEPSKFLNVQSGTPMGESAPVDNSVNNAFDNMFNGPLNVQTPASEASLTPNSTPTISAVNNNVTMQSPASAVEPNNSINEEISSIVSDALKNQPVNQPVAEQSVNDVPPISLNNEPVIDSSSAAMQSPVAVESQNMQPANNVVSQGVLPQDSVVSSIQSPINFDTPVVDTPATNVTPLGAETPANSNLDSSTSNVNVSPQSITPNVPDYAGIVQKLRAYADEIEKNGHFVNLEEVDLGNQYKVIFTFDK